MGIEVILGGLAFAGLFALWVIMPSWIRRREQSRRDSESD